MTGVVTPLPGPAAVGSESGDVPDPAVFRAVAQALTRAGGQVKTAAAAESRRDPGQASGRPPCLETLASPLDVSVGRALDAVAVYLGEDSIGGWDPAGEISSHLTDNLDARQAEMVAELHRVLAECCRHLSPVGRVLLLLHLWWKAFGLWDQSLAYRSLKAVVAAAARLGPENAGASDWEQSAWQAAVTATEAMSADGRVYAQMNLASPAGLGKDASQGARAMAGIAARISDVPRPGGAADQEVSWAALSAIGKYAGQMSHYYGALVTVADALAEFEGWLLAARPAGGLPQALYELDPDRAPPEVGRALQALQDTLPRLAGRPRSECEPWVQMMTDIVAFTSPDTAPRPAVLLPERVWVRYCFPFAVDGVEDRLRGLLSPRSAPTLAERIQGELNDALGAGRVPLGEIGDLAQTEFFEQGGGEFALYGGIRACLPDLVLTAEFLAGTRDDRRARYRAWLDISRMGNFCLCVEAEQPLDWPAPQRLYGALRAATPFAYYEPVALDQPGEPCQWDNLNTFARDIIRAAATALWQTGRRGTDRTVAARYVRGNMHEIVIVQTSAPVGDQARDIAADLDASVGGRILLRSVGRASMTVADWVRFPPQQDHIGPRADTVQAVPEVGYTGDWFVNTGETTVFGLVAAPAWMRDVYPEAAQFAGTWSPLLRLWSKRLQRILAAGTDADPEELRRVEHHIRQHLAQIRTEELCATLAYRRFLDALLDAIGVGRLDRELEAELQAAEQLADWYNERAENRAVRRRDVLLALIAVFGVFSLSDFLSLTDATSIASGRTLLFRGSWQDSAVWAIFLAALGFGVFYLLALPGLRLLAKWINGLRKGSA